MNIDNIKVRHHGLGDMFTYITMKFDVMPHGLINSELIDAMMFVGYGETFIFNRKLWNRT